MCLAQSFIGLNAQLNVISKLYSGIVDNYYATAMHFGRITICRNRMVAAVNASRWRQGKRITKGTHY
jgi:hypothetical protein